MNDNSNLDPQDPIQRLAHVTPEELDGECRLANERAAALELVKDNPVVESAFRQAMKDMYGQPYLFDYQLEMTVEDARKEIHAMQHLND